MNTSRYIAKKMGDEQHRGSRVAKTTSLIVTGSVALSIAVIMIALAIVSGFRKEIRERAAGFAGQIIITPMATDYQNDSYPLSTNISYLPQINSHNNVLHTQYFAFRHGLLKTEEAMQGVVIKGVGKEFDRSFFESCMAEGRFIEWNDSVHVMELVVSRRLANSLKLSVAQKVDMYFVDQSVRVRRFTVAGIYDASLEEFDQSLVIGDIRVVQQLNGWSAEQVGGIELLLRHPDRMEQTAKDIEEIAARYATKDDPGVSMMTVRDLFSHLFDWLGLIDLNLWIVLGLMIAVAGVNMISGLLIMLFDKTSMIGLLKAMGMKNKEIRTTFIYRMGRLVLKGMLIGNAIALVLCMLQKKFSLIALDQTNYAVDSIPIHFNVWSFCLMNLVSFLLILVLMFSATAMVARISPERSLRVK